ncbi:MAG: lipid IV(A) 3-deoxy-D-manno-octulosonic acid transferase [Amphritea sp.]
MARLLYSALFYLLTPFLLLKLWLRGRRSPEYRQRWAERFGFIPQARGVRPLWIHSVSVGETVAIMPLIELLLAKYPDIPIVVTTMTPTGSERVRALFADRVMHFYCPYDLPDALARFHSRVKPRACVIVETELWPNLVASCFARNVPVMVANARLSAKSAAGYAKFVWLTKPMLKKITCVAAQNAMGGQRFLKLGLDKQALAVTGSIKLDVSVPESSLETARQLRDAWGADRPVLLAASTHDNEEQQMVSLYKNLLDDYPKLLLVLVPRHPERFQDVYSDCLRAGLHTTRRSLGELPSSNTQVYLGDTMGDLLMLFATADSVFVGGSLIERGGHNPLEPALLAKPVLMGPHVYNFQQIVDELAVAGALLQVDNLEQLEIEVRRLFSGVARAEDIGRKGQEYIEANRGALDRLLKLIEQHCRL